MKESSPRDAKATLSLINALATALRRPPELVREVFEYEFRRISSRARFHDYIAVLAAHRVRDRFSAPAESA